MGPNSTTPVTETPAKFASGHLIVMILPRVEDSFAQPIRPTIYLTIYTSIHMRDDRSSLVRRKYTLPQTSSRPRTSQWRQSASILSMQRSSAPSLQSYEEIQLSSHRLCVRASLPHPAIQPIQPITHQDACSDAGSFAATTRLFGDLGRSISAGLHTYLMNGEYLTRRAGPRQSAARVLHGVGAWNANF